MFAPNLISSLVQKSPASYIQLWNNAGPEGAGSARGIKSGSISTGRAGQGWARTIRGDLVLVITGFWPEETMAVSPSYSILIPNLANSRFTAVECWGKAARTRI